MKRSLSECIREARRKNSAGVNDSYGCSSYESRPLRKSASAHTGEKESPSLLLLGARILFSSKEQQAVYLEFTYLRLNASTHTQIAYYVSTEGAASKLLLSAIE